MVPSLAAIRRGRGTGKVGNRTRAGIGIKYGNSLLRGTVLKESLLRTVVGGACEAG